jgi:hypothetical protein
MNVSHSAGPAKVEIVASDPDHAITRGLVGKTVGTAPGDIPVFWVGDPQATPLGKLRGGDRIGLAMRKFDDWTSIYLAAPSPTPDLLREVARVAGVHIWHEGQDVLYVDRSFFAVHTREAGTKRIRLPRATDVVDLFSGEVVVRGVREFTFDAPAGVTRIYYLGPADRVPHELRAPATATAQP